MVQTVESKLRNAIAQSSDMMDLPPLLLGSQSPGDLRMSHKEVWQSMREDWELHRKSINMNYELCVDMEVSLFMYFM